MTQCVCELCFPNSKEICELLPNCFLFENKGMWGLMTQFGHKGDELLFFPDKPRPDPDPETLHENDAIAEDSTLWMDTIDKWWEKIKMTPTDGYFLVNACKKAGWQDKMISYWLYDFAGKKIIENENHETSK